MTFTNRINYSVNITTSGNLIVGGSSSIGNLSASSGNISNLTGSNITTNSLVGDTMNLSGRLSASTATIPQLVATNVSAGSLVGSTARFSSSVSTGNFRLSDNASSFTQGNLTINTGWRTHLGQMNSEPNTFYINSRGDVDLYGSINLMVNNSSGMYINNSGLSDTTNNYVGINNTYPVAPLDLGDKNANRKIVLLSDVDNNHQYFGMGTNADAFRLQVDNITSDFVFFTGTSSTTSSELLKIKGTGNVGIGGFSEMVYPPIAMTSTSSSISGQNYGNGVYVATASSNYPIGQFSFSPFKAFNTTTNADANDAWHIETASYDSSNGAYNGQFTTTVDGSPYAGEWLQIQLPNPIVLGSYTLQNRFGFNQLARTWKVVGSNDGSTWTTVDSQTDITDIGIGASDIRSFTVNSSTAFSYYRIIGNVANVGGYFAIGEWRLFSKYTLDVNGDCRINVSSPSYLEAGGLRLAGWDVWNTIYSTSGNIGITADDGNSILFKLFTSGEKMRISSSGNVGIGTTSPGSTLDVKGGTWGNVRVIPGADASEAAMGFYGRSNGSVDSSTTNLGTILFGINLFSYGAGFSIRNAGIPLILFNIANDGNVGIGNIYPSRKLTIYNNQYQDVSMSITAGGDTNKSSLFLGTPAQGEVNKFYKAAIIAQGSGGSSRNDLHFCLDNSLLAESASLSDSKMVLTNNGNIGIGITNPDPLILEYPSVAMTSTSTSISGQIYGNGVYIASASSNWTQGYEFSPFKAFNKTTNADGSDAWHSETLSYNTTTGAYLGSFTTTVDGSPYLGEWLQIRLPSSIILRSYSLQNRTGFNQLAKTWKIVGSNNGSTWFTVDTQTNITNIGTGASDIRTFTVNSTTAYSFYRIIGNEVNNNGGGSGYFVVGEWRLNGVESSSSIFVSTLHINDNINYTTNLLKNGSNYTFGSQWITTGSDISYNTGNVGIGTTNPEARLDVRGDLYIGNSTQFNFIAFSGTTGDGPGSYNHTYIGERIYGGSEASELLLFKGNDMGAISGPDRIRLLAGEHRFDAITVKNGSFDGVGAGGLNEMIITSSGNVGIGITQPTSLLHVSGGNIETNGGWLQLNSAGSLSTITFSGSGAKTGMSFNQLSTQGNYSRFDLTNWDEATDSNRYLDIGFATDRVAGRRMILRKGGNIGINNSSPSYSLDINSGTAGAFEVSNNNGLLVMNTSGNIGIGTTSPQNKLTVKTNINTNGIVHTSDTITLATYLGGSSTSGQLGTVSNHPLGFFTNNAAVQMLIATSGNIGIGTSNPINKLSIEGPSGSLNGPHTWVTNTGDPHPVFQQLNWRHDNVALNFDCYYDSTWKTSSASTGFQIYKINSRLRFISLTGSAGSAATSVDRMILGSTGNVGIGVYTPTVRLDVVGNVLVNGSGTLINESTNTNDATPGNNITLNLENSNQTNNNKNLIYISGQRTNFGQFGTGSFGTKVLNYGTGGENCEMLFYTTIGGIMAERMKVNTGGNLLVGTTGIGSTVGASSRLNIKAINTDISGAEIISYFEKSNTDEGILEIRSSGYLWQTNAANACLRMGRGDTGRSINATGTINANGADYAEYMIKNDNCGIITKGDICGIDQNSQLTDNFDEAIAFAVKTTNPSYVGGDNWGGEDSTGPKPQREKFETEEEYNTALEQWEAHFEELRSKVDRIAFCGIVPVNVLNATVGDYIVPIKQEDGKISGISIPSGELTFEQYKSVLGLVVKIGEDGRAIIKV